jgi:hypothetical protein
LSLLLHDLAVVQKSNLTTQSHVPQDRRLINHS